MSKRLVILGAGESGVGAAILGKARDYDVFVSDGSEIKEGFRRELEENNILYESGTHTEEKILNADEVVKSPGIPEKAAIMKQIRTAGIPVISEIEFAYRYKGIGKIVAITGSNGKTTTTSLIYHIFRHAEVDSALVGNIGYSFARQVALDPKAWYVAEVSSFQLDDIKEFRPEIAIITNVTEDHLDRYEYRMENYVASKFRIVMNQTSEDYFIYNEDDPVTIEYLKTHPVKSNPFPFTMNKELNKGAFITNGQMTIKTGDEKMQMSIYDFALKGKHNQYNTMAAGLAPSLIGIRKSKIREAVQSFEAIEHRMEFVITVRGVDFINDSKATNVNSTWFALESMSKPTILIMGGIDKGNDYSMLLELAREKVKAIVCLGLDNVKIHEAFGEMVKTIIDTRSADEAVRSAFRLAEPNEVILLSPACASFDLFNNYEDRGNQFKQAVKNL
ncbi:MAG TPA: UDP-N-acetylmuramoyl-L-alanine--D-glutamate ligase [Flavitalea sp.]|nr:UDP-N-acetylmuramoyl-L-alanine--D-glutamate ligase [Flavitalea sp.]